MPEPYRPIGYLTQLVQRRTGGRVRLGPFAGMRYIGRAIGSAYLPKLLGTYERELASQVELACSRRPRLIVNIGAGEGYYAVGLAMRNPQATVIAFEADAPGRSALAAMKRLNAVSNVEVRARCDPAELKTALAGTAAAFVVCDVEGDEANLLDPQIVPALCQATILAEMHDFVRPGISETLETRFALTHRLTRIWQEPRTRADFPYRSIGLALLPKSYVYWAVSEWRPARMSWLWMEPHG